jgi:aspartate aminotransferase
MCWLSRRANPTVDTPDFAKAGGLEAIHAGYTKYTPSVGIAPLREAISEKFHRENQPPLCA